MTSSAVSFFCVSVVAARDIAARGPDVVRVVARFVALRDIGARAGVVVARDTVAVRAVVARGVVVDVALRCDTAVRDVMFVVPAPRIVVFAPVVLRLRTVGAFAAPRPVAIRDVATDVVGAVPVALPRLFDATAPGVRRVPARATSSPSVAHDGKKDTNIRHVAKKTLIPFILLYVNVSKITESRAREK